MSKYIRSNKTTTTKNVCQQLFLFTSPLALILKDANRMFSRRPTKTHNLGISLFFSSCSMLLFLFSLKNNEEKNNDVSVRLLQENVLAQPVSLGIWAPSLPIRIHLADHMLSRLPIADKRCWWRVEPSEGTASRHVSGCCGGRQTNNIYKRAYIVLVVLFFFVVDLTVYLHLMTIKFTCVIIFLFFFLLSFW